MWFNCTMTTKEFITKHDLQLKLTRVLQNPNMEDSREKMINYCVEIFQHKAKPFMTFFSTGLGWVVNRVTKKRVQNVTWSPKHNDFLITEKGHVYTEKQINNLIASRYKIQEPNLSEILDCLRMDFSTVECENFVFENWAESLGYSSDSISAKKTFDLICEQRAEFFKVFGMNVYNDLMQSEEE